MGGVPEKASIIEDTSSCSNKEVRTCGDGLTDIVNTHWKTDVLTIKMDVHMKGVTVRALREVAECTVFPRGVPPGPRLECFAEACIERLESRWGHEQWFWDWPWPEIMGSAATHFWPARLAPFGGASDQVTYRICFGETQVALEGLLRVRTLGVHP